MRDRKILLKALSEANLKAVPPVEDYYYASPSNGATMPTAMGGNVSSGAGGVGSTDIR